jgi:hypothetical protein
METLYSSLIVSHRVCALTDFALPKDRTLQGKICANKNAVPVFYIGIRLLDTHSA